MASKKILIDIQVTEAGASAAINKTAKSVDNLSKSTQRLAGRTSKNKAESGLNNAILMETGRLASDASYGFQGMANNLGQLVSLIQIASKNSGGFGQALKDVGKSIMGTGGVLIAVQLLISFLPKIAKKFKEIKDGTSDLSKAVKELRKDFLDLKVQIEESNEALIDQDDAMETLLVRLRRAVKGNIMFRLFGNTKMIDETIEKLRELGVEVDKSELLEFEHDPKGLNEYIEELIKNSGKLEKVTQDVVDFGTAFAVERILGDKTPVELAEMELELFVKTQEALGVKQEEYVKSRKYKILLAKIERAKRDALNDVKKEYDELEVGNFDREIDLIKETGRIREQFANKEMALILRSIDNSQQAIEIERQGVLSRIEFLKSRGLAEEQAAIARYQVNTFYDKLLVEDLERLEEAGFRNRMSMLQSYADSLGAISELIGETTQAGKIAALAEIAANTAVGYTQGLRVAQKQSLEGVAFAFPVFYASQIAAVLSNAIRAKQILKGGGSGSSATSVGGTTSSVQPPDFNVVGASETSQLGMALGQSQTEQVVNVLWSDIDVKNNEDKRQQSIVEFG